MSKDGAGDTVLTIELPDPNNEKVRHSVSVDTENEESLVDLQDSLLEIYGDAGEDIAVKILGLKAFIRAILAALVKEGEVVRGADGRYRLAKTRVYRHRNAHPERARDAARHSRSE